MATTTKTNKFKINSVNLESGQVEVTYINKNGPIPHNSAFCSALCNAEP